MFPHQIQNDNVRMFDTSQIWLKQQNDLNFDRINTLRKSVITFNDRIVDGHIEFKHMLLSDKYNKLSTQFEIAIT